MRTSMLSLAAGLLALSTLPLSGQEQRRQLDAHVHGEGKLAIAIEGGRVGLELESPAKDIVGFEHAPSNDKQRKALESAKARLVEAAKLFELPAAAGCALTSAKVDVVGMDAKAGKGHKHDHGHAHGSAKGQASGKSQASGKPEAEDQHAEFRVTYALDCKAPEHLKSVGFPYFKVFKGADKLDVTVIGPKGQSSFEVNRKKASIDLVGVM